MNTIIRTLLCLLLAGLSLPAAAGTYPDRLQLQALFWNGEFAALNELIMTGQQSFESTAADDRPVLFAVESLAYAGPEAEYLLERWVKNFPRSYVPYLVRAYYFYNIAWAWRGHEMDGNTAGGRRQKMLDYLEGAANDLSRAIELHPSLTLAHALAIRILMVMDREQLRQQAFVEASADFPASYVIRSSYLWGLKPKWGGSSRELIAYIDETRTLIDRNPALANLLGYSDYIFAESLSDKHQYEQAAVHYDFAVEKGADHIVYLDRGINHYKLGNYDKALEDFETSLAMWPQNPRVLRWRANALMRMQKQEAALADLELAVSLAPYDRNLLMSLAFVKRKLGRFEGVTVLYDRALYYNSNDAEIWFERGMHHARDLFDFTMAVRDLKRATELAPQEVQYWYHYAASLHYNNDCAIRGPLDTYLSLCRKYNGCNERELEWAQKAKDWLSQNGACVGG